MQNFCARVGEIVKLENGGKKDGATSADTLGLVVDASTSNGELSLEVLILEPQPIPEEPDHIRLSKTDYTTSVTYENYAVNLARRCTWMSEACLAVSGITLVALGEVLRHQIARDVSRLHKISSPDTPFIAGTTAIPASGKVISDIEKRLMVDASLDGWLTTGRFNEEFEKKLASFMGVKHLLTVNSGSSANLVAFHALMSPKLGDRAIRRGDEIITVAAGFPTTINPALQVGVIPVFVDVNEETFNIDVSQLELAVSSKTKAIIIAHTLGNPFNVTAVLDFCKKYNLWLIEDCCDALGSTFHGQKVGTFGDIATLSFYPAHHITMGEGGAVFTNSGKLKPIIESIRDWGRDCFCSPGKDNTCGKRFDWQLGQLPLGYDHKYIYSHCGFNLKITDMQAACGVAQLSKLESFIKKRQENFDFLYRELKTVEDLIMLPKATPHSVPSWFGFPITLRSDLLSRTKILKALEDKKIGTRLLFAGNVVRQPYMQNQDFRVIGELPNTEKIMRSSFWLGIYPGLDWAMLDFSSKALISILRNESLSIATA